LTRLGTGGSTTIAEANLPVHQHTMNHTHGSFTSSGQSVSHNHTVSLNDPGHMHTVNGNEAAITPSGGNIMYVLGHLGGNSYSEQTGLSYTGTTVSSVGNASVDHTHSVTVTAHTGNTGTVGSGTAYFQPYLVVNYIIKHD
jgi:microcystin-dependent protein